MKKEITYISQIENSVEKNHQIFTSMGVVNGLAGVSLFYYYAEKNDLCISYLEKAIEGLNDNYLGTNIVDDIIGIGKLLNYYEEKEILNNEDVHFYFENYDPIIEELLIDSLKENKLSPVSGILKYANYFVYRAKHSNKNYDYLFSDVLSKIEELSHSNKENNEIYWVSNVEREGRFLVELGAKHGVMGVIDCLVNLYEIGFEKEKAFALINKGLKYVSNFKLEKEKFIFPFCTDNVPDAKSFSFGVIYGDLGIAYVLYRAGVICEIEEYEKLSIDVLVNSSKFRDDEDKFITDANLFYGSLGIASVMKLLQNKIKTKILDEAINYWYAKTEKHKVHETKWADFDTTFNKFDINAQLSLSHGITGIGIMLMNFEKKLDFDFLKFIGF
jgi:hypothetical protein